MEPFECLPEWANLSSNEVLISPSPRIWYQYERWMEYIHHIKKDILQDDETIIEEEFGEEWEKATAAPQWKLDQLAQKEKENARSRYNGDN